MTEAITPQVIELHPVDAQPLAINSQDRKTIRDLKRLAKRLLEEKVPVHERMALLRGAAMSEGMPVRDGELMAFVAQARRELQGKSSAVELGDEFDIAEEAWAWDQVIAGETPNLLVALQKVGKTALMAGLISAWHYGTGTFLGHALHGPCPPVLIAGTDQTMADWFRVLQPAGLMDRNPENGKARLIPTGPIRKLWHRSQPIYFDMEGLEEISVACEQYPGALLLCDTYAALIAPLGLDEAKPEAAEPLYNLMELIEPHKITPILIHHASKSRANERASNASRNSNAIPAAVSQIISLSWLEPDKKGDQRINLTTEGRNSKPVDLVIEQVDRSQWVSHGTAEDIKESQRREKIIRKLDDRQSLAFDELRDLWDRHRQELTAPRLLEIDPKLFGTERQARRALDALVDKDLASDRTGLNSAGNARTKYWRPAGADLTVLSSTPSADGPRPGQKVQLRKADGWHSGYLVLDPADPSGFVSYSRISSPAAKYGHAKWIRDLKPDLSTSSPLTPSPAYMPTDCPDCPDRPDSSNASERFTPRPDCLDLSAEASPDTPDTFYGYTRGQDFIDDPDAPF